MKFMKFIKKIFAPTKPKLINPRGIPTKSRVIFKKAEFTEALDSGEITSSDGDAYFATDQKYDRVKSAFNPTNDDDRFSWVVFFGK